MGVMACSILSIHRVDDTHRNEWVNICICIPFVQLFVSYILFSFYLFYFYHFEDKKLSNLFLLV